jgi:hypothetical protein
MADTYGVMDLYVQYANCEGLGVPLVEASVCGIPVCATNYSGMSSVLKNVGGHPIPVLALHTEAETNRLMALPDNTALAEYIREFVAMPETMRSRIGFNTHHKALTHYGSWSKVAQVWMNVFDSVELPEANMWATAPIDFLDINSLPPTPDLARISDEQFVNWLLTQVVRRPDWSQTYIGLKMIRDLIYGNTSKTTLGFMSNDASMLGSRPAWEAVDRDKLYGYAKGLRHKYNQWEAFRHQKIQAGDIRP